MMEEMTKLDVSAANINEITDLQRSNTQLR
jgi:hypothetical protein